MRTFTDLQQERPLKKFLRSPLGTLYYTPFTPGTSQINVRHFDSALPPTLVGAFVDLIQATGIWLVQRPMLAQLVQIEQPTEVGADFVARPHYHPFNATTAAYADWDDPPEPPAALEQMRATLRALIGHASTPRELAIATVLTQSLLEPSGKTYFAEERGIFIVFEPRLTPDDVIRWATLMPAD